jgi:hypothetical protein
VLLNAPQVVVSGQRVLEWEGDDLEKEVADRERDEWEGLADAPY